MFFNANDHLITINYILSDFYKKYHIYATFVSSHLPETNSGLKTLKGKTEKRQPHTYLGLLSEEIFQVAAF